MSKNPVWEAEQAQFDRESLDQLSEPEREEYERFLPILEQEHQDEVNDDRRHRRKRQIGYFEKWLSEEATVQTCRGSPPDFKGPDYLSLIEKEECLRQGRPFYADKLLEEIIGMLTAPQR